MPKISPTHRVQFSLLSKVPKSINCLIPITGIRNDSTDVAVKCSSTEVDGWPRRKRSSAGGKMEELDELQKKQLSSYAEMAEMIEKSSK
jgi:hypothetical protein